MIHLLPYFCHEAELTHDLIIHIRHFPVKQVLSQLPVNLTLGTANHFMAFATFIPWLVCTLGTDGALSLF